VSPTLTADPEHFEVIAQRIEQRLTALAAETLAAA
jgi:hypothetical protein